MSMSFFIFSKFQLQTTEVRTFSYCEDILLVFNTSKDCLKVKTLVKALG